MQKELFERLINISLDTGADFSEVFYENKKECNLSFYSSLVNKCTIDNTKGVGLRIAKDTEVYYANTNNLEEENLVNIATNLSKNFSGKRIFPKISLTEKNKLAEGLTNFEELKEIKEKLYKYDKFARSLDERIIEVIITVSQSVQEVVIAKSNGTLVKDFRPRTRFNLKVIAEENKRKEFATFDFGESAGFEIIEDDKIFVSIENRVKDVLDKLKSVPAPGGEMPVIIANGFGGVIIHEACGHALEASQVMDGTSILADKLGQKIASSKVTIIDDGTLKNFWGSTCFDDEGNETKKNILVKNGILKTYLVDEINNRTLNCKISGSGRREDFTYAPISRMNNTYLAKGTDKVSDMIKSIDYGLYAKTLGGGSVNTTTGDFNFAVIDAYMIRDGKIAEPVKGASLVGNTLDILEKIEMVGDDLDLSAGLCGSASGWVPVTVGEPTIKVSKILVGGDDNAK